MKPIGLLMREHRLIERMIGRIEVEIEKISQSRSVKPELISASLDFFRTYADRTHHGKEEAILFKSLAQKPLSAEHRKIMDELVSEHVIAREKVGRLAKAKNEYEAGRSEALNDIVSTIKDLVILYPEHIEKEDKRFFYPTMAYFSPDELDAMLARFYEFDQQMIHEKYRAVVENFGKPL
jgi:hemerythrin-like domain-containing protein